MKKFTNLFLKKVAAYVFFLLTGAIALTVFLTAGSAMAEQPPLEPLEISNPVNKEGQLLTAAQIIGQVIRGLVAFLGVVALVIFVWAGFLWMTAGGNQEKIKKAKTIMTWAVLGIAAVLGSYTILNIMFQLFGPKGR